MLIRAATSTLLVVDIQERLLPAIDDGPALVEYSQWLLRVARALDVPVLASEQYSKGLGPTVAALRDELEPTQILEKLDFSAGVRRGGGDRLAAAERQGAGRGADAPGRGDDRVAGDGRLRMDGTRRQRPLPRDQPQLHSLSGGCSAW